jgi:hypothetical protein
MKGINRYIFLKYLLIIEIPGFPCTHINTAAGKINGEYYFQE